MKQIRARIKLSMAAINDEAIGIAMLRIMNEPRKRITITEQVNRTQVVHKPIAQLINLVRCVSTANSS
jgi:hypothetical protein